MGKALKGRSCVVWVWVVLEKNEMARPCVVAAACTRAHTWMVAPWHASVALRLPGPRALGHGMHAFLHAALLKLYICHKSSAWQGCFAAVGDARIVSATTPVFLMWQPAAAGTWMTGIVECMCITAPGSSSSFLSTLAESILCRPPCTAGAVRLHHEHRRHPRRRPAGARPAVGEPRPGAGRTTRGGDVALPHAVHAPRHGRPSHPSASTQRSAAPRLAVLAHCGTACAL